MGSQKARNRAVDRAVFSYELRQRETRDIHAADAESKRQIRERTIVQDTDEQINTLGRSPIKVRHG